MSDGVHQREWAIVLFATSGLSAFVENALLSIERCGIDTSFVEVVYPANAESEIAGAARVFGAKPRMLEQLVEVNPDDLPSTYVEYGTPEFSSVMKYRLPALRAIMAEGKRIISADVDVVWLRNPLSYLSDVLDVFPCAFQTEAIPLFPPMFCMGFIALSGAPACFELIDHFMAKYVGNQSKRMMQPVLRDLLIENPHYLTHIFPLPEGLFPNGLLYRAVDFHGVPPLAMSGQLQPFVFHGNWARGLDKKHCLLAHTGHWLVPASAQNGRPISLGTPIPLFLMTNFRLHKGAELRAGPDFEVITPAQQWSYALSFIMDQTTVQPPNTDQSITVTVLLRVHAGRIGIGLLKDGGPEFIVEKLIQSDKEYQTVTLRVPMSKQLSEIIIRNCWDSGKSSRVTVQSIDTRLSQR